MEWWSDGVMGTGTVSPLPLRATYRSKVSRLAEISESQFKPQRRDERREAERSRIARSAWRLCSLLPLSNSGALTKAAASCAHSIRFARFGCGSAALHSSRDREKYLRAEGVKKPSHRPKAVFTEGADFQG